MFEIIPKTNINFTGRRKLAFGLSGLFILLGLAAFVAIMIGRANMGLDFSGGTMIQGNFEKPVTVAAVREALTATGHGDAEIQELVGHIKPNSYSIRVKGTVTELGEVDSLLLSALASAFPDNAFHLDSSHEVGPAIGKLLRKQASMAVLYSMIGILIYIWVRFDFRVGVTATIGTFHDVLAVLGIVFLLNKEITLLIVTALLTVAGYSLSDKVVVFDRVRENLKLYRKKGEFETLLNTSINEVLSRTFITSTGVLITLVVLYIFGSSVIRDFALAMFLGVLVGTYSSIFLSSGIMLEWENRSPKRFK
ncbi:MAG TPA: protein translocase subunit SecF [Verrucomicrobiae bacterium]|nr:protein translocase subunit SecF [Verrucomicrobiae bacterium]